LTDRDIVDEIDALVDAQLQQTRSGYDHNINQDDCPHPWCAEKWHGLAITKRMQQMRSRWSRAVHYYEDEQRVPEEVAAELDAYRYDEDDSEIICPGSTFVGEFEPPEPRNQWGESYPEWTVRVGEGYVRRSATWDDGGSHLPVEVQFPRPLIVNPTITLFRAEESGWQELGTIESSSFSFTADEFERAGGISIPAWDSSDPASRGLTIALRIDDEAARIFAGESDRLGYDDGRTLTAPGEQAA
jgi:hypothetical protein